MRGAERASASAPVAVQLRLRATDVPGCLERSPWLPVGSSDANGGVATC
jgi:hypothetical protein